jgi:hypothetical protein
MLRYLLVGLIFVSSTFATEYVYIDGYVKNPYRPFSGVILELFCMKNDSETVTMDTTDERGYFGFELLPNEFITLRPQINANDYNPNCYSGSDLNKLFNFIHKTDTSGRGSYLDSIARIKHRRDSSVNACYKLVATLVNYKTGDTIIETSIGEPVLLQIDFYGRTTKKRYENGDSITYDSLWSHPDPEGQIQNNKVALKSGSVLCNLNNVPLLIPISIPLRGWKDYVKFNDIPSNDTEIVIISGEIRPDIPWPVLSDSVSIKINKSTQVKSTPLVVQQNNKKTNLYYFDLRGRLISQGNPSQNIKNRLFLIHR